MEKNYRLILNKLLELKNNFGATGLKIEFETEYTTEQNNDLMKRLVLDAELNLAVKISGCGSIRDVILAEKISPQSIIAPMIESTYALEKFYVTALALCDLDNMDLYFNLETIAGFGNLDKILASKYINKFKGVVFGRSDFCASLNLPQSQVDSELILNYINKTTEKIQKHNLEVVLGGCISDNSKNFINQVEGLCFTKYETRKVIFDKSLAYRNFEIGLKLALEFESLWLNLKGNKYNIDKQRLESLADRVKGF